VSLAGSFDLAHRRIPLWIEHYPIFVRVFYPLDVFDGPVRILDSAPRVVLVFSGDDEIVSARTWYGQYRELILRYAVKNVELALDYLNV
jgi:hypothetical protein